MQPILPHTVPIRKQQAVWGSESRRQQNRCLRLSSGFRIHGMLHSIASLSGSWGLFTESSLLFLVMCIQKSTGMGMPALVALTCQVDTGEEPRVKSVRKGSEWREGEDETGVSQVSVQGTSLWGGDSLAGWGQRWNQSLVHCGDFIWTWGLGERGVEIGKCQGERPGPWNGHLSGMKGWKRATKEAAQ